MHSIYAFLAIVLIGTLGASAVEARGSALSWVSPCTLDVVLVTFQDATTSADKYDYHLQDRPHGSNDGGAYPDPDSSYTLRDFERLFSGGYAGTTHLIDRGGVSYLLNRRTTQPFGGRYLAFYDYAAPGNEGQGLMIWRREFQGEERPILIVADERRYRDARDKQQRPSTQEYQDMLSDPFPGRDKVAAVSALTGQVGLRQATNLGVQTRVQRLGTDRL